MSNATAPGRPAHAASGGDAVLVTGGAGFIGSEIVRRLGAAGRRVVVLDRLGEPRLRRAADRLVGAEVGAEVGVEVGVEVVEAELADVDLAPLLDRVDRILHLAARPGVQTSWGPGFDAYLADNVAATARLLEACLAAPHLRSVILASSSSVYGDVPDGFIAEETPIAPVSPYGVSKAAVELLAATYAARGVPVASLRYFTVYGRGQRPDMAISRMIESARAGEPFFVRGDGTQQRDFTHVADVARATIGALDADLAPATVLNVGSGRPVRLLDVIEAVGRMVGRPVPLAPAPEAPGDPTRTAADHRRATELLGWRPEVALDDGLADQIAHAAAVAAGVLGPGVAGA